MFGKNIFLIISFLSVLKAGEYYISFQYIAKNDILIYEKFNCSKAMENKNAKFTFLFSINTHYKKPENVCKYQKNLIIQKLLKNKIFVTSYLNKNIYHITSVAKITFLPHLFDIIIKNDKAYFFIKGEE